MAIESDQEESNKNTPSPSSSSCNDQKMMPVIIPNQHQQQQQFLGGLGNVLRRSPRSMPSSLTPQQHQQHHAAAVASMYGSRSYNTPHYFIPGAGSSLYPPYPDVYEYYDPGPQRSENPQDILLKPLPGGAGMAAAPQPILDDSNALYEPPPIRNDYEPRAATPPGVASPNEAASKVPMYSHITPPRKPSGPGGNVAVSQLSPPSSMPVEYPRRSASGGTLSGRRPSATASMVMVDTDSDGVVWIKFEYTRNRVKWLYRIRCDVDTVSETQLTDEFRRENCIYPKAMVPLEEYKGHRQRYETECNHIGWRLAFLNPDLQGKRGLIQRAVDSYRNSSGDISVRSRRVRRLAKQQVAARR